MHRARWPVGVEPNQIAEWFDAYAPGGTAVAAGRIAPGYTFGPTEERAIAGAVSRRREEFITGRRLARAALERLGCEPREIPRDASFVPRWPEGFIGTISHGGCLCVAHVGRTRDFVGMGVDIEVALPLDPSLVRLICRPDEHVLDDVHRPCDMTIIRFAAKEAFFKSYFPAARTFLEFHDVYVDIDTDRGLFEAFLVAPDKPMLNGARAFTGRFERMGTYILAAAWIRH